MRQIFPRNSSSPFTIFDRQWALLVAGGDRPTR